MSVTVGRPSVSVPVLSSTMAFTLRAVSRLSASLIRIPFSAPFPMPTMMAVGVASPNAQGQAMMVTVTAASKPWVNPLLLSSHIQTKNERTAMLRMVGTKIAAMRSTNCCTGALLPCASCTMRMIWARTVSLPTLSAMKLKLPFWLMVPAYTLAPGVFSVGSGSPVSMLSST